MSGETPSKNNETTPAQTGWEGLENLNEQQEKELAEIRQALRRKETTSKGTYSRADVMDIKRKEGESTQEWAARIRAAHENDPSYYFQGERNFNDKKGKERAMNKAGDEIIDFDRYPRLPGESKEEYGQRLRDMHAKIREYEAKQTAEDATKAEAEDGTKQVAEDGAESQAETEDGAKAAAEDKAKAEAEDKAKAEAEDKAKAAAEAAAAADSENPAEEGPKDGDSSEAAPGDNPESDDSAEEDPAAALRRQLAAMEAELAKRNVFSVVSGDFTHDKKELAHDYAEQQLNAEVADAKGPKGFVKRIWKGNLFKKYYEKKYEREIFSGKRKVEMDGNQVDLDAVVDARSASAMERIVMGTTEEYASMIHTKAGERLTEADAETTAAIKEAIMEFASAKIPEGGSLEDLKVEFNNRVNRLYAENRDKKLINNALATAEKVREMLGPVADLPDVAEQARMAAEHQEALERAMEGFKVYNAEVRDNVRTEAHRDNIDKLVNAYESSKLGQFIPPEIVAAAAGTAYSLIQSGARAAAGAGLGIGVSGIFAGLRERNRVTEDRTRKQRDAAAGYEYTEDGKDRLSKKRAKYEATLGGTFYQVESAGKLTSDLTAAMESGDSGQLLAAIAAARVRTDYSDEAGKDLICYSAPDKLGDERLALDLALIRAENSLSDEDKEKLAAMKGAVEKSIQRDVEKQDKKFKHERLKLAAKASAKTVVTGAAVFFGSQELIAAIDPNKIGVFEKAGILKTENANDAEETILASLMGGRGTYTIGDVAAGEEYRLEENGFKKVEVQSAWTEKGTTLSEVSPAEAASQKFKYDGWANNGTKVSDGNELRAYLENGQFRSGMFGNSTMGGQTFNYEELAAAGKIKGYITIGGAKFELVGSQGPNGITWGDNGIFTTTTGETIKAIGDNGEKLYKYFEIALDNGTDADGFTHIIPFATDVGRDAFSGTMSKVTETVIEHPAVYDWVKDYVKVPIVPEAAQTFTRGLFAGGAVLPGTTSRVGLGRVRTPEAAPETPEAIPGPQPSPESGESPRVIERADGGQEGGGEQPAEGASQPETPAGTEAEETSTEETETSTEETGAGTSTESNPETDQDEEDSADKARRRVFEFFGGDTLSEDSIGANGVGILTSDEPASVEFTNRIQSWWSGLSPEMRQRVREYEASNESAYGATLRVWLSMNPETPAA